MSVLTNACAEDLREHEGFREKAYKDSLGIWTIGYGQNLQALVIDRDLGERWLYEKIHDSIDDGAILFPSFERLSFNRQRVIVNLAYNLGRDRLSGFVNTRRAVAEENWEWASEEMYDSLWAKQVGHRATVLCQMMKAG